MEESLESAELQMAKKLRDALDELKSADPERGRLWAIAATEAEKLIAWIGYVTGKAQQA